MKAVDLGRQRAGEQVELVEVGGEGGIARMEETGDLAVGDLGEGVF